MDRGRVTEAHYITPVANLSSIMKRGILSHRRVAAVDHVTIADEDVQRLRRGRRMPNGRPLHDYANAYFDARNPMMSRRRDNNGAIVVLRINPGILDIPGTIIADGNAASAATRFEPSPDGLAMLDERRVYATYWTDPDPWRYYEKKRQRCAEVLVPDVIPPHYISGGYVCRKSVERACRAVAPTLEVVVSVHVFFV